MPDSIPLPEWIVTSRGEKAPFDLDRISQSLFAASESLGRSNAFLARELTDAACHFLALEFEGRTPTTKQVADTVAKVLRELGQKELAQAYTQRRERRLAPKPAAVENPFLHATREASQAAVQRWLSEQGQRAIFSRDLLAAQDEGLLHLGDQSAPASIVSAVVDLGSLFDYPHGFAVRLKTWSEFTRSRLVFDSPEWIRFVQDDLRDHVWTSTLNVVSQTMDRDLIVNLNVSQPPAWAVSKAFGPLFEEPASLKHDFAFRSLGIMDDIHASTKDSTIRIAWHLHNDDFINEFQRDSVCRVIDSTAQIGSITFVFDRSKDTVSLGEGVDRQHPGVMLEVGLRLPTFLRMDGIASQADRFLEKLPTLARMAASAGAQKRRYLRQHSEDSLLTRQFLLDRVNVVVVPLGLDEVVQAVTGQRPAGSPLSLNFAKQIVQTLSDSLAQASRAQHLNLTLDSAAALDDNSIVRAATMEALRDECVAAGKLHAIMGAGTLTLAKPDATAEDLVELLAFVWKKTHVQRLRFVAAG